jgi:hypothetical protein
LPALLSHLTSLRVAANGAAVAAAYAARCGNGSRGMSKIGIEEVKTGDGTGVCACFLL